MYFTLLNFVSTTSGYHLLTPARSYATPTVKSIISTTIKIRHDVNLSNKPSTPTPFLKTKQPAFTTVAGGEKRLLFQNLIFIFRQILNLYFSSFRKTLQSSRANIKIYNITIVSFPLFPPLPSAGQTSKSLVLDLLRRNISYFQYLRFWRSSQTLLPFAIWQRLFKWPFGALLSHSGDISDWIFENVAVLNSLLPLSSAIFFPTIFSLFFLPLLSFISLLFSPSLSLYFAFRFKSFGLYIYFFSFLFFLPNNGSVSITFVDRNPGRYIK